LRRHYIMKCTTMGGREFHFLHCINSASFAVRGCFLILAWLLLSVNAVAGAVSGVIEVCPAVGIQQRTPDFKPDGIILTTFDKSSMWVYDIGRDRRYPLPDTYPCGTNCHLSRDMRWITYVNPVDYAYAKMRLDGTERTLMVSYAADVEWWSETTLLVWTPDHEAYLQVEGGTERELLDVRGIISLQPGGTWGLLLEQDGDGFSRSLLNVATRNRPNTAEERIFLGTNVPYFDASGWSPNGDWLAFVAFGAPDNQVNRAGGELFGIQPHIGQPIQWTDLTSVYGAIRINGQTPGTLSWSPDSTRVAFWVTEMLGPDAETDTGSAVIHILEIASREVRAYCGFSTIEHTPNPPRLIWSPDGTTLVFGGNVQNDDKGYLLLALDTTTGIFTELSNGVFPALGTADAIAWGLPPG
jgi:hypothetical protein